MIKVYLKRACQVYPYRNTRLKNECNIELFRIKIKGGKIQNVFFLHSFRLTLMSLELFD